MVLRGRDGEPKRSVNLQVAWSALTIQAPAIGSERKHSSDFGLVYSLLGTRWGNGAGFYLLLYL